MVTIKRFPKLVGRYYSSSPLQPKGAQLTDLEKLEFQDTPDLIHQKASKLAEWISSSKYLIAFTGAGISTSAGIPDFRSGTNTIVPTGPGQWEAKTKPKAPVSLDTTIPTFTHMSLSELMKKGILKFLISQNVDVLHLKSSIDVQKLAELHGNANVEKCLKCKKQYLRDYKVRKTGSLDHLTGNLCDDSECSGALVDNIVLFGDSLDKEMLAKCYSEAEKADLCFVLGSSIRVNPAAIFPRMVGKNGRLAIVNLQKTPLDPGALRVNSLCDPFMEVLMKLLGIEVPEFKIYRKIEVKAGNGRIRVRGLDSAGKEFSVIKKILHGDREICKQPFDFYAGAGKSKFELVFYGHFGEPSFFIDIDQPEDKEIIYNLEFCPGQNFWTQV